MTDSTFKKIWKEQVEMPVLFKALIAVVLGVSAIILLILIILIQVLLLQV